MKKINLIDQYLLEKYPNIWNTKIVWMLALSLIIHIIFFFIGYVSHSNPESLHKEGAISDYFFDGLLFIQIIISVLMLVGWLILLFKNNAFKNFYPSNKWKLFSQFLYSFIIIFACITFYFSYMFGFKVFINQRYDDESMSKDVDVINKSAPFLSQNIELYTLENRKYPRAFSDLYCETDFNLVLKDKPFFVFYDRVYQYFSTYSKTVCKKDRLGNFELPEPEKSKKIRPVYSERKDNSNTFFFKKDVVDLSKFVKTTKPSFYNYSNIFYQISDKPRTFFGRMRYEDSYDYYGKYADNIDNITKAEMYRINKQTVKMLDDQNQVELEKLFAQFLEISKKFAIHNNLEPKAWTKMVYQPENFEINYFIKKYVPKRGETYDPNYSGDYDYSQITATVDSAAVAVGEAANVPQLADSIRIKPYNPNINKELSPRDFFYNNLTDYFYYDSELKSLLTNVDEIKSTDVVSENIHIYYWIAFLLSCLLFSFRVTSLRTLLFSIITVGILVLSVALIGVIYAMSLGGSSTEYFISYLLLLIGTLILLLPMVSLEGIKKNISGILITITISGFVFYILLILGIISMHQQAACQQNITIGYDYDATSDCKTVLESLGLWTSYLLLVSGFIFLYFYTSVIQKWKALPDKN